MRKRDELENPRSCLNKAADDEPIFVLRASDLYAPILVEMWADLAGLHNCDPGKLREARELAGRMRAWPKKKFPD